MAPAPGTLRPDLGLPDPPDRKTLLPRYNVFEELDEGEETFADDQNIRAARRLEPAE